MQTKVWVVIPCYNEEEILEYTAKCLEDKLKELQDIISPESKILLVDDGSIDSTWEIIQKLHEKHSVFLGIKLSRNQGHQNALLAGMMYAKNKCDCIVTMDADLQDDIDVLREFIIKFQNGCQIVYGIRKSRKQDTFFKRKSAEIFYATMKKMGAGTFANHADYRLMSQKALTMLDKFEERNLFLRGIIPTIGLKNDVVYYERKPRTAGNTKYPLKKMITFAIDGITSFSLKPLQGIVILGLISSAISIIGLGYVLCSFFFGYTVPGWTALACSIWLLGGIQLLCIGILGEYIGKIFSEVKRRPRYLIDEEIRDEEE